MYKERYCKEERFLEGKATAGCSYTWRSIISCRDLADKGARWKIADGRNIRIFEDMWVLGLHEGKVVGKGGRSNTLERVSDLMTHEGEWDELKVRDNFMGFEAEAILNTPIKENSQVDMLSWTYEANKVFTVKSAYRCQMEMAEKEPSKAMHSSGEGTWWEQHVWACAIQPKAKVLLWRAFKNYIPTMGNLKAHHTPIDGVCSLCKDRWDSTEHALLFCPAVAETWKGSKFKRTIKQGARVDLRTIAERVRNKHGVADYDLWCLIVWRVWQFRCSCIHEEQGISAKPTQDECDLMWETFLNASMRLRGRNSLGVVCGEKSRQWPAGGTFMVDVDAMHNPRGSTFWHGSYYQR